MNPDLQETLIRGEMESMGNQIRTLQSDLATLQARLIERTEQSTATAYRDAERIRVLEEENREAWGVIHVLHSNQTDHSGEPWPKALLWMERNKGKEAANAIQTHYAPHADPPWIALNMADACKLLEGYPLPEAEKSSLPLLMAGYCRLIDEAELIGYGQTEAEAIAAIPRKEAQP